MSSLKTIKTILFSGITTALLTACSGLFPLPDEASKKIVLDSLPQKMGQGHSVISASKNRQIIVDHPLVFSPLDSTRVALKPTPNQIDYYAQIEWGDRLSTLIQESIIYSLQNSHHFAAVTRSSEGIIPDYSLKTEVRQFHVQRNGQKSTATLEYFFQLVKSTDRQVIADKVITQRIDLQGETMPHVVQSLNQAHVNALEDLVMWLK